jgi:hypothetical protein
VNLVRFRKFLLATIETELVETAKQLDLCG